MADGMETRGEGGVFGSDNFTQRICRSVILTSYSIAQFLKFVKGVWTNFEVFLRKLGLGVDKGEDMW